MAFNLVQAGSSLYAVNTEGGFSSALTLPTGITLADTRKPRFARFGQYVIVANTPSRPISVSDDGTVRPLVPLAPTSIPVLTTEAGGTLIGRFLAKQTFVILDAAGNVIAESAFGPIPTLSVAVSSAYLRIENLSLSTDTSSISGTRLYRTTNGPGGVYFQWATIAGNTQTVYRDDLSDAALQTLSAPSLASGLQGAPDLTLVASWSGRVWGVPRHPTNIDKLRYTEAGTMHAWNALNTLNIPPVGEDRVGITALIPLRDMLGVGRQNRLLKVIGATRADIRPLSIVENVGILSQESTAVYNNTVFFLWFDGVYQWDADGVVTCVSDRAGVRSWFTTTDYFNQRGFPYAHAILDPINLVYRLFLMSAGSSVPDRWVEYHLRTQKFYGPHKTSAFVPTCSMLLRGANNRLVPMIGSREGYLSYDSETRADWDLMSIPMRITMGGWADENPDVTSHFGQVSVQTAPETGGTLVLTPRVGEPGRELAGTPMLHDLREARGRLDRIGDGRSASLVLANDELNRTCTIYGLDIDPVWPIGRR